MHVGLVYSCALQLLKHRSLQTTSILATEPLTLFKFLRFIFYSRGWLADFFLQENQIVNILGFATPHKIFVTYSSLFYYFVLFLQPFTNVNHTLLTWARFGLWNKVCQPCSRMILSDEGAISNVS